jgi:hypothetical protein
MYNGQDVIVSIMDDDVNISKRFISNLIDESTVINEIDSPYILSINDVGIHELENGYKALENLTRGTEEWNDAVNDINNSVLDLIAQYPALAALVENEGGVLTIDINSDEA